jgi:hypothetical protein
MRKKRELYGVYTPHYDITFVMQDTIDSKTGEVLTTKVTGFYSGEPDDECIEFYNGKPTARYDFSPVTKKNIFRRVANWFLSTHKNTK